MKKLLSLVFCGLLLFGCSDKYDDSALRNDLNDLENRVAKLEELCKQMNTNISSLQKIVVALQDNLSISKVEQISDGYIIHFSDGSTATIKNGKNSEDAPIIGVKKDTDGIYYWTLDGEWLTDEKGNKVKAQGTDGKDGVDGEDGTNGKDGITPQLKIENGRWMLSMDNGKTWTDIGQATGADGTDGEDGVDGKDGTNGIHIQNGGIRLAGRRGAAAAKRAKQARLSAEGGRDLREKHEIRRAGLSEKEQSAAGRYCR